MKKLFLLLVSFVVLTVQNNAQTVTYDGYTYNTVTIGTQTWLKENLRTRHFNNGDLIPNIVSDSMWLHQLTPAMCYYNNDSSNLGTTYGALYNYYVMLDNRNVCPVNYRIPSSSDWSTLKAYVGGADNAGFKLKEAGTGHWLHNTVETNSYGFSALPGGTRLAGEFNYINSYGYFYVKLSQYDQEYVFGFHDGDEYPENKNKVFATFMNDESDGKSIRCVKSANNSINENNEIRNIKTYPNPTTDKITIELDKSIKNGLISIYNQQGQLVNNQIIESLKIEINVSDLNSGLYFVKIDGENVSTLKSFTKK